MPIRNEILMNGCYYHVFNRGVNRNPIFFNNFNYSKFLTTARYYQYGNLPMKLSEYLNLEISQRNQYLLEVEKSCEKIVKVQTYGLMPNHYHFSLLQTKDNGIENFISKTINSYVKYLNISRKMVGPLFQGPFKAKRIETDEQLIQVTRYIHLNPVFGGLCRFEDLLNYKWTSLNQYLFEGNTWIDRSIVMNNFKDKNKYMDFLKDQADVKKKIDEFKYLAFEDIIIPEV